MSESPENKTRRMAGLLLAGTIFGGFWGGLGGAIIAAVYWFRILGNPPYLPESYSIPAMLIGAPVGAIVSCLLIVPLRNGKWARRFVLSQAFGVLILIILSVAYSYLLARETAIYVFPNSKAYISIERNPMHQHLAEYHRKLVFVSETGDRREVSMAVDTGGYSLTNVYGLDKNRVLLEDAGDRYELNLQTGSIEQTEIVQIGTQQTNRRFLGAFDSEGGDWHFIPAKERAEKRAEFKGN